VTTCFGNPWTVSGTNGGIISRKIETDWRAHVTDDDIVLVPGDLSWAGTPADVEEDLAWLASLPGHKVFVKGNHDWWLPSSKKKARDLLPESVSMIQNDAIVISGIVFFGSRLWTIPGLDFPLDIVDDEEGAAPGYDPEKDARVLNREMERLKLSIAEADRLVAANDVHTRICLTHFPPTDFSGTQTPATDLLAKSGTDLCVFGHVHGFADHGQGITVNGVRYFLTSCDYLGFKLLQLPLEPASVAT
jgi:hypothetical protein